MPEANHSNIAAAALQAEAWAGEPFLREDEDPGAALAPGTARRRALDDAQAEIDAGLREPSQGWKVRYGLMLGLERVLSAKPPSLATGLELRRHQIDALAGMLTELIAANQRDDEPANGNGNGTATMDELEEEDEELELLEGEADDDEPAELTAAEDPGAVRRFRFRHPTASGKTVAAAGFVESARTL
ncbi:MAG: ribonuclease, partial [Gaiellaceae bacterium]|nr:ribonuclease [Gaiellaceae bacterium]